MRRLNSVRMLVLPTGPKIQCKINEHSWELFYGYCVSCFFHCCDKMPEKRNLRGGKVYFGSQLEWIWPSWCRRPGSRSVRPWVTLYLQLGGRRRWMLINDELTFFSFLSFFPFTHSCIWYRSSDLHLQTTKDTRNFKNILLKEQASLKRLCDLNPAIYNVLQNVKLWRQWKDQWLLGTRSSKFTVCSSHMGPPAHDLISCLSWSPLISPIPHHVPYDPGMMAMAIA